MSFKHTLCAIYESTEYKEPALSHSFLDEPYPPSIKGTAKHNYFLNHLSSYPEHHEDKALTRYTKFSSTINKSLWMEKTHDQPLAADHEQIKKDVSGFLERHPAPKEDIHVYTGVSRSSNPKEWVDKSDGIVHIPSFTSTSISPQVARDFARARDGESGKEVHILKIKVRKGQKVGGYVQPHSYHGDEGEFLIKPNHLLKIDKTPNTYTSTDGRPAIHVWHAHILEPHEIEGHNDEIASYKGTLNESVSNTLILGIGKRED